ncbi:hypothetical protein [Massilia aerilata]|uniref:Uncharacterized protein n=1 Tax=Massilia aerilata TaxID=453817 RepID=A0ABW0RZP5_9BURK
MKKTFGFLAFPVLAAASPLSHASDPLALPDLVKTSATALNKPEVWEAGDDYQGRMVQFDDIDTSKPGAVERAFAGLNAVLEKAGHVPLNACVFVDALVVRRVNQPPCGMSI